ncbi:MAG: transcriptional regulator NrdR [Rickettsiales bacterium]|jgi:transcriptional repressor NrdR|nr:transcriptional regulator NrdR [Rickettsiales bacterium]
MKCPFCNNKDTSVIDTRESENGETTKRKRECSACGTKFATIEKVLKKDIIVIKKTDEKEIFEREKLFNSIFLSSGKRLTEMQIEDIVSGIYNKIETSGAVEIKSSLIAEMVLDNLERIDKIAYIRFASVYMNFETIDDVDNLIKKLSR